MGHHFTIYNTELLTVSYSIPVPIPHIISFLFYGEDTLLWQSVLIARKSLKEM